MNAVLNSTYLILAGELDHIRKKTENNAGCNAGNDIDSRHDLRYNMLSNRYRLQILQDGKKRKLAEETANEFS